MVRTAARVRSQDDDDIAARAAWLHFVGGKTQAEIAERLGLSPTRAHRAIARAQSNGLVHITVEATAANCVALEDHLAQANGLNMCRVAMDLPERGPIPLKALGSLGGDWLGHVLDRNQHGVIGVSHGRTIAAMVENMRQRDVEQTVFVSMLGGLTRSLAANPYDVIHRLAQKTGADGFLMPVPLFANSANDKSVLMAQSMLTEAFERMQDVTLAVVGIGDLATSNGACEAGGDVATLRDCGAVAEILGQFIDADGQVIATPFDGREMAMPLEDLRGREVVAIAGGASKVAPIRAALNSGLLTGLIIDEATARCLVEGLDAKDAVAAE